MDMSQYLEIFIEESKEHLQGLNEALLRLEENPGEKNEVNEIFRAAHTLKGMSATMGFTKMSTLTHDMEDVLHAVRSDEIELTPGIIDTLFQCLDALENYVESVIETSSEGDNEYKGIINALKAALTGEAPTPAPEAKEESKENEEVLSEHPTRDFLLNEYDENIVRKAKETDMNVYKLTVVLNKSCVLKSARSFIIFQTLEKHSDIIKSEPKVEDIEDERFDQEFTVVIVSEKDKEVFTKEIMSIAEVEEVIITDVEVGTSQKKEERRQRRQKDKG
jgi:two-component system chemotaxis sensor kinase CheA